MDKEKIIEKFKGKGYDDFTIKLLLNFLKDFEELELTKYLPIEEVIERICNNVHSFQYGKEPHKHANLGYYDSKRKCIVICKGAMQNEDVINMVMFHELLHCISDNKENDMVGLKKLYRFEEEIFETGRGINEGVTEYLTKKRNRMKKYKGQSINAYPVLTMEIENLIYLIGEKELLGCYFNHPEYIDELLETKKMDSLSILQAFDQILNKEAQITDLKEREKSAKNSLFDAINGESKTSSVFDYAGQDIADLNKEFLNYLLNENKEPTLENFKKIVDFISRLYKQECGLDEYEAFHLLLELKETLKNEGHNEKEIDQMINDEEIIEKINFQKMFEKMLSMDKNELLEKIYDDLYGEDYDKSLAIDGIMYNPSYRHALKDYLYCGREDADNLPISDLINLGKLLKEHPEIDFNDLTYINYKTSSRSNNFDLIVTSDGRKFVLYNDEFSEVDKKGNVFLSGINRDNSKKVLKLMFEDDGIKMFENKDGNFSEVEVYEHSRVDSNLIYLKKNIDKFNSFIINNDKENQVGFELINESYRRRVEFFTKLYENLKNNVEERKRKYSKDYEDERYD